MNPDSVAPGGVVRLTAVVRNRGSVAAPASTVSVRRDDATGTEMATAALSSLDPGIETTVDIDVDTTGLSGAEVLLFARLDDTDAVAETDEGDNVDSVRVILRSGPDLTLFASDVSTTPADPRPDETFDFRFEIRNLGETEVASFTYKVERLDGGVVAELLADASGGPIAAGGALPLVLPLSFAEGEHEIRVTLDEADLIVEEVEDNNITEVMVAVVDPDQADLAISETELILTPATPLPGDTIDVQVTVRNLGNRDATATVELAARDADGTTPLATFTPTLAAGAVVTLDALAVTLPTTSFAVVAVADPEQAVVETDESNNRAEVRFRDLPDVAIGFDNLEVVPVDPAEGDVVSVTMTVRNAGRIAANNVTVDLYAGDPAGGGVLVGGTQITEIPAAGNRRVEQTWIATGGATVLTAVLDAGNTLDELSESNNEAVREIAVPRSTGPNLEVAVTDRTGLAFDAVTQRVTGAVTVTMSNSGDTDVLSDVTVRLFEDRNGDGRRSPDEPVLATGTATAPLAVAASQPVVLAVDAGLTFYRSLVWAEVDPTDSVAEQREDDNRVTVFVDGCELAAPANPGGPIEPIEEWYASGYEVQSAPIVAQLSDDDGNGVIDSRDTPDVIFHSRDSEGRGIVALSGLDGTELWRFRSSQANPLVRQLGQVATADLDGDGITEVIGMQRNGRLLALDHSGALVWVSAAIEGLGDRSPSSISIGDLDADGVPEIAVGRAVLSNQGALIAVGTGNRGQNLNYYGPFGVQSVPGTGIYGHSVIADVDLDGRNELVAGDTLYRLSDLGVLEVVWNNTVASNLMRDGFNAVGQLDGDPEAEIVYVSSGQIMVLNHDGSVRAGRREMIGFAPFTMPTFWGSPPTIVDLDGNGSNEILAAGATEVIAYNSNLSQRWRRPNAVDDFGNIQSLTAFDFDGDGEREVLYLDERNLRILDGGNGNVRHQRANRSKTAVEYPTVADVDGDGRAEILLPSNTGFDGNASTSGLHVLGHPSWQGTRPIWNQYAYQASDILLDGTVPSRTSAWPAGDGFRTNVEAPVPPLRRGNLTIGFPRVGVATGNGVPVTLRIGNGGIGVLPAGIEVALYDGDPASVPAVATVTTSRGLRPGGYEDVVLTWVVAGSGGELATAVVDPSALIDECDEADNRLDFTVDQTLLPDLVVAAGGVVVTAPSAPIHAGQPITLEVTVENVGSATAPASSVRLYDGAPGAGAVIGDTALPELAPGASTTVELTWDSLGATGLHLLHVEIDPDDTLVELDEANNGGLVSVDLVTPTSPDLTITDFTISPSTVTAGSAVLLRAEVLNRGATLGGGFAVAFRVNGAEATRVSTPASLANAETTTLETFLPTGALGGTLPIEARVDPDDVISEIDETNNRADGTLIVEGSSLAVQVTSAATGYGPGEDVDITLTITNNGTTSLDETLDLRVTDAGGALVATLADAELVTLATGSNVSTYTWNTGTSLAGTYAVTATVAGLSSSVLVSVGGDVAAQARIFSDRDVYTSLQQVVITGAVSNVGINQVLENLSATTTVRAPDNTAVFTDVTTVTQLVPGAVRPVASVWEIAGAAPGTYTLTLELRDPTDLLIAYASTAIVVEDSASTGAGLRGELVVTPDTVGTGAPFFAGYTVTNNGNAAIPDLVLALRLVRLRDGEIPTTLERDAPIAQSETLDGTFGVPTLGLSEDVYLATLVAELPLRSVRLDSRRVTLVRGVSVGDLEVLEGDSGSQQAAVPITLSSPATTAIDVTWSTADGTATAGVDYQAAGGTITFQPGEVTLPAQVTILGDVDPEPSETFLVSITAAIGAELGDAQAVVTLIDEEGCSGPNLLVNAGAEADVDGWTGSDNGWQPRFADPVPILGGAYFSYRGAAASATLSQDVDLSAYASQIDGGAQEFAFEGFLRSAGADPDGIAVTVQYLDAADVELDRFTSAQISDALAWQAVRDARVVPIGTRGARVTIEATRLGVDDVQAYADALVLRSLGVPVATVGTLDFLEGNTGTTQVTIPVVLSCPAAVVTSITAVTESVTSGAAASAGVDYTSASATLDYPVGVSSADFVVDLLGDELDELDERFAIALATSSSVVLLDPRPEVTILDDDGPVVLSVLGIDAAEATGEAVLDLALSEPSGRDVRFTVASSDQTALAGSDYQTLVETVTLAPGETSATVTIPVTDDPIDEGDETFLVTFSAPVNVIFAVPTVTVTVADDDRPSVSVLDPVRVTEGDSGTTPMLFDIVLSNVSTREIRVPYATTTFGTATAGEDFTAVSGEAVFAPGTTSLTVSVDVIADLVKETEETIVLALETPTVGTLADPEAVGAIFDDDGILISVADALVTEPVSGATDVTIDVTLSKSPQTAVSVDYVVESSTATEGLDFTATSGTLDFAIGVTSQSFTVPVLADLVDEPLEDARIVLSNPVESVILDGEAELRIRDADTWHLNNQATIEQQLGCVQLTPATNNRRGSAWRTRKIDLTENFDRTFRTSFSNGVKNSGADGMVFVFHDAGETALGGGGTGIGYSGLSPSLGVEIDTHRNGTSYDTTTSDHIAINLNGVHTAPQLPPVTAIPAEGVETNVEDGQEHDLRIVWNAEIDRLEVLFDGVHRVLYDKDLIDEVFSGTQDVFWGFTSGTGLLNNRHYFCATDLCFEGNRPLISVGNGFVTEGDAGSVVMSVPVTLSCPSTETITANFATRDDSAFAGFDYQAATGSLTFAPGETSKWIHVTVFGDTVNEGDETFHVELADIVGADLRYQGVGTITSDDSAWFLNGNAREDEVAPGCLTITRRQPQVRGSVWRTDRIDLAEHFDRTFDVYLGPENLHNDGIVFALQDQGSGALGSSGSSLGYGGISPSVGIEIDTSFNNNGVDISADHMTVLVNGNLSSPKVPVVTAAADGANIEDDQRHKLRVVWNADTKALEG
ncbi:MAG: CARDB domain-containing protein, partial [Acidobacteriota bacterium]